MSVGDEKVGDEKARDATSGALFAVLPLVSPLATDNEVNNSTITSLTRKWPNGRRLADK